LRVLAIVTLLTYVSIVAAYALAVLNFTWRMSLTFLGAMLLNPTCNFLLIRHMLTKLGPGGGGAACATASLITEVAILISLLTALGPRTVDRRLMVSATKSIVAAAAIVTIDHILLRPMGPVRLAVDAGVYVVLILASGAFDFRGLLGLARSAMSQRKQRRAEQSG